VRFDGVRFGMVRYGKDRFIALIFYDQSYIYDEVRCGGVWYGEMRFGGVR
jgi:hypothetical protein